MAGWASRHGGQKRGGGGGGGGLLSARLAQQQMGLELLRQRGGIVAGSGSSSTDLLQQHQQQAQLMSARNGGWQQLNGGLPSWMLGRGLEGGGHPLHLAAAGRAGAGLHGFGAGKIGTELDGYGMLQTQQVEIDGKLHTMFCLPADSSPRGNMGMHGTSLAPALGFHGFDYNAAARAPERGILGGGPVDARWARPRSPRRTPPDMVPPMSPRRSRSPYRHRRLSPQQRQGNAGLLSRRSPSRHFRVRSPRDASPRSPRHRGNRPLLHRHDQGLLPRPPLLSFKHHLLPNPMSQQLLSRPLLGGGPVSPRRDASMLRHDALSARHDYLGKGRDLGGSPTGRDHLRRSSPDFGRPSFRSGDPGRDGRGILGAAEGARAGMSKERQRGRSKERNRDRRRQDLDVKKHALPLEQAIAAKRSKLADDARREDEKHGKDDLFEVPREKTDDFRIKVDKARAHYARVLKEDSVRRKKYEDAKNGRAKRLECLVCGSKGFSDLLCLVTHANEATDGRKREGDHQGFHEALCELLGWNTLGVPGTKRSVTTSGIASRDAEDTIVWPATLIVENTRTQKTSDGRWTGLTVRDMATYLKELELPLGRPRPIWSKEGLKGFMLVEFLGTLEGLEEAEKLHRHFEALARGRKEWESVQSLQNGHLENGNSDEGPESVQVDETTEEKTKVLFGYLALSQDLEKIATGKRKKRWRCMSRRDIFQLLKGSCPAPFVKGKQ